MSKLFKRKCYSSNSRLHFGYFNKCRSLLENIED